MNMAALITRTISLLLDVLIVVVAFVATMSVKLGFFMVELVYEMFSIIQLILVFLWYFLSALLLVLSKLGTIAQMIQSAGVFLIYWSFKVLSLLTSYLFLIGSHLFYLIKKITISDSLVAVVKVVATMSVKLFSSRSRLLWNIRLRLNF